MQYSNKQSPPVTPRIIINPGEPAGIGSDIVLQIAQQSWPCELIVVSDLELLSTRAKQLGLPIELKDLSLNNTIRQHSPGILNIIPVKLSAPCQAGQLDPHNAHFVVRCLEVATDYCLHNSNSALVTGPVHKAVINSAGIPFTGHTEFLATRCGAAQVLMLFVVDRLKVALVTTHVPLADVPKAITGERLISTMRLLNAELKKRFGIAEPKILVCGLNPHAGEAGYLGREEIEVIGPALSVCRAEKMNVVGPLPADTIFTQKYIETADVILAMYHDQALPVVKYIGFSKAVNVTLGLPIIRTSVDHGTALDIAGSGQADAGSLAAAIQLAIELLQVNLNSFP